MDQLVQLFLVTIIMASIWYKNNDGNNDHYDDDEDDIEYKRYGWPTGKTQYKKAKRKKKRNMVSLIMMEITTMRTKGRNNDCNVIGLFGILVVFGDCISSILLNISWFFWGKMLKICWNLCYWHKKWVLYVLTRVEFEYELEIYLHCTFEQMHVKLHL